MAEQTACVADVEKIIGIFEEITTIPSLSLHEKPMADEIKKRVSGLPYKVFEDQAGAHQGNLIYVPETFDPSKPSVAFFAHLDTARNTGETIVLRTPDRITSDGNSQLGADNRLGVSLLLYAMLQEKVSEPCNLLYVFTVAEEIGMVGANALDLSPWNVRAAYVFDSSLRPGRYISTCGGMYLFRITCHGKAAHSAVNPEDGISAIAMAGDLINRMYQVKLPPETTMNIGLVSGGEGTNIIPDKVMLEGEVRGFSEDTIQIVLDEISQACVKTESVFSSSVAFQAEMDFSPYSLPEKSSVRHLLEKSLTLLGLSPEGVRYKGGSDANALYAKGIPAVNIGIGAQKPHANDEFVLIEDIQHAGNLIITLQNNLL